MVAASSSQAKARACRTSYACSRCNASYSLLAIHIEQQIRHCTMVCAFAGRMARANRSKAVNSGSELGIVLLAFLRGSGCRRRCEASRQSKDPNSIAGSCHFFAIADDQCQYLSESGESQ